MIFNFFKFIFGRRRNLPRQCFFFNDDFSHYSMMRCVHAYPIIIFHLIVFFFSTADTVNSRLEDTLLWRTTLYGQQLNLTQKK